ncbi:MAG: acyl-CoA dehydrogenase family protein [Pseudomonadota bacterium]
MQIEFSAEQKALQQEIKHYLNQLFTPELTAELAAAGAEEGGGPEFRKALRKLGEDGYISMSWPKELGGNEASAIDQYIFTEEIIRTGFPYPFLTTEACGPVMAQHASELVRETVVKGILKGEVVVAIGYSEPGAGTDLAALQTKAVRDGDEWVINGQKIWTSLAEYSDYVWLAARTDPDAPKHKGITMFVVPTDAVGFSMSPIWTLGSVRTNATFYENIRLKDEWRVGDVNQGWKLITGQLNRERLSLVTHGQAEELYLRVARWAASTETANGEMIIDRAWVRSNLAKVRVGLEALKLVCWKQAWAMDKGTLQMADASVAKVYGTEFFLENYRLLMEIVGQASTLRRDEHGDALMGALEHRYRTGSILTFGGGTNEVQREIIAGAGLWMPRGRL